MQELGLCAIDEPAQKLVTQGSSRARRRAMSRARATSSPRARSSTVRRGPPPGCSSSRCAGEKDVDWSDEQVQGQHRFSPRLGCPASLPKIAGAKRTGPWTSCAAARTRPSSGHAAARAPSFNTAISSLMELSNAAPTGARRRLLARVPESGAAALPLRAHIAEELWRELGAGKSWRCLHWPDADPALVIEARTRSRCRSTASSGGEVQVRERRRCRNPRDRRPGPKVALAAGKTIKRVWVIPKRLVNFVSA